MNEEDCRKTIAVWESQQGSNYGLGYYEAKAFLAGLESERKRSQRLEEAINQFVHPYVRRQCVHGILLDEIWLVGMQEALADYEGKIK